MSERLQWPRRGESRGGSKALNGDTKRPAHSSLLVGALFRAAVILPD
ncbi:MAG: hypothetical protein AB7O52_07775 [Planctomycetota bacterium]